MSICSIRIRSRNWDIVEKPQQPICTWLSLRVLLVDCEFDRVPSPPPPPPLSRELFPPILINTKSDLRPLSEQFFFSEITKWFRSEFQGKTLGGVKLRVSNKTIYDFYSFLFWKLKETRNETKPETNRNKGRVGQETSYMYDGFCSIFQSNKGWFLFNLFCKNQFWFSVDP